MPQHPGKKKAQKRKFGKVMGEFRRGTLKSSSGQKVKSPGQAKAIAASEAGLAKKRKKSRKR